MPVTAALAATLVKLGLFVLRALVHAPTNKHLAKADASIPRPIPVTAESAESSVVPRSTVMQGFVPFSVQAPPQRARVVVWIRKPMPNTAELAGTYVIAPNSAKVANVFVAKDAQTAETTAVSTLTTT